MKNILGIDLGTSSVKLLLRYGDGQVQKAREPYDEQTPSGWLAALVRACTQLDLSCVDAVGLSELNEVKSLFPQQVFLREITMPHPDIISYPIPRLLHILRSEQNVKSICMPKEIMVRFLTGCAVSDPYSWRGLANLETGNYSRFFLDWLGISESVLPPLRWPGWRPV